MTEIPEERRLKDLRYLKAELEREAGTAPDGTEADFRDLLDFACTTTVEPASPPAPTGKPEKPSAQSSE